METLFATYEYLHRHERAFEIMDQAELEVSHPGLEALKHDLCNARSNARLARLEVKQAYSIWSEAERFAIEANNPVLRARCQQRLTIPLLHMGRLTDTCEMARRAIDSSDLIRNTGDLSIALTCATTAALALGNLADAEELGAQAMQLIRETRYANSAVDIVAALACLHCWRGDFDKAHATINMLIDPSFVFDNPQPFRNTVDRFNELIASYSGNIPQLNIEVPPAPSGRYSVRRIARYCMTIDLGAMHDKPQAVAPARTALGLAMDHGIQFSSGWVYLLPRMQGVAAHMLGRPGDAAADFEKAIRMCDEAGATAERAITFVDWARLDMDDGRIAEAARKLDDATAIFSEHGMLALQHQAESIRGSLHGERNLNTNRR